MTALPQDHAVLDCQAHGQPPVTIRWLKNGVRLAESEHIQFLPNGSLYIPKIKHTKEESDEGFYQCLSQNKYGAILSQRSRLTIASKYGAPGEANSPGNNKDFTLVFHCCNQDGMALSWRYTLCGVYKQVSEWQVHGLLTWRWEADVPQPTLFYFTEEKATKA